MTDTCVIEHCPMTVNGRSRLCSGDGLIDPRCMVNWASTDPEDQGTYDEYLDSYEDHLSMPEP